MATGKYSSEEVIHKLREADVLLGYRPPAPATAHDRPLIAEALQAA